MLRYALGPVVAFSGAGVPYPSEDHQAEWDEMSAGLCYTENRGMQSPIDLPPYDPPTGAQACGLNLFGGAAEGYTLSGHGGLKVTSPPTEEDRMHFDRMQLLQFHAHHGSEHTVNGVQYPLEVHFVHDVVSSCEDAQSMGECDLATDFSGNPCYWYEEGDVCIGAENRVIGIFFELGGDDECSPFLQALLDLVPEGGFGEGDVVDIPGEYNPYSILQLQDLSRYWAYPGGFTTPPCSEIVDWYVLENVATACQAQIDAFAAFGEGNFRAPQPIADREVYQGVSNLQSQQQKNQIVDAFLNGIAAAVESRFEEGEMSMCIDQCFDNLEDRIRDGEFDNYQRDNDFFYQLYKQSVALMDEDAGDDADMRRAMEAVGAEFEAFAQRSAVKSRRPALYAIIGCLAVISVGSIAGLAVVLVLYMQLKGAEQKSTV